MGSPNGGIIGVLNPTSNGGNLITSKTATGSHTTQPGTRAATIMVVAGGGGGAGTNTSGVGGAGAGAGGLRIICRSVCGASPYSIVVGAGGSPGPAGNICGTGFRGTPSSFAPGTPIEITSTGGGGAMNPYTYLSPTFAARTPGGSGSGFAAGNTAATGNTPPVSPPQGNAGGIITGPSPTQQAIAAGGGGSGSVGGNATGAEPYESPSNVGGNGGSGTDVTPYFGAAPQPFYIANGPNAGISAPGIFAGGGGGGGRTGSPTGGPGGGGNGGVLLEVGYAGTTNTGGGGGGSSSAIASPGNSRAGGAGGSGIVIIKELNKASGLWPLSAQFRIKKQGLWPS
jgi:hypothetical protein